MALDPPGLLGHSPSAVGQFGDSPPQGDCLVESSHGATGVTGAEGVPARFGERLVPRGVSLGRVQTPAGSLGQYEAVTESVTQSGDMGLQGLGGGTWRIVAPEQFRQHVGRYNRTTVQSEHREDGARLRARYHDGRTVHSDLKRPQNPQFHR